MTAKQYRKKPVVIDAIQFSRNGLAICDWATDTYVVPEGYGHRLRYESEKDRSRGDTLAEAPAFLVIKTLEGDHRADVGDYIIKGVQGEFYPCKPDIFASTYEPVS